MHTLPQSLISLIHYVELSNAGWWEETTDRCILGVLWYIKEPAAIAKIRKEVVNTLDIDLKLGEINSSLGRLVSSDQVVKLHDGRYKLTISCENTLSAQVLRSKELEFRVKEKFNKKISEVCKEADTEKLWASFLQKILVPLVSDSGAKIYEFLFSNSPKNGQFIVLTEEFLKALPEDHVEDLSKAISDFIDPRDKEVAKFIFSYLDAYFAVSSSGLSKKVIQKLSELRKNPAEFEIYVDTNFIYSVLGLHDNPSNEAATDLLEMAQAASQNVKVMFVVNPITLEETKSSINYKKLFLENINYPSNLAKAARSSVSGLYDIFFQQASMSAGVPNPFDYFSLYEDNLIRILEGKNISVVNNEKTQKYFSYPDVISDVSNQADYEKLKYGNKAKSENKIINDVVLWYYVKDLREKTNALPIDVKYWIATVDYKFVNFDRFKSEKLRISPVCMLPTQLIQVFRFFSPRSMDFEKIILNTMRSPLVLKEYDPKIERVAIKIIKQLALYEGIENISVETLHGIITDAGLREKFINGDISEAEQTELIRDRLAQEIVEYQNRLKTAEQQIEEKTKASLDLMSELKETNRNLEEESKIFKAQIDDLKIQVEVERHERLIEKKDAERKKSLREFIWLSVMSLLPYPLLLAFAMYFLGKSLSNQLMVYGLAIGLTFIVAAFLTNLLVKRGIRDAYIAESDIFKSFTSKYKWKTLLSFLMTVVWLVISKLIEEFVVIYLYQKP